MSYTLRLRALRCNFAQERGGDEIYLRMNGETIFSWEVIGYKFHDTVKGDHTNQFDFQTCKVTLEGGTQPVPGYQPSQFIFSNIEGPTTFQLCESDEGQFLRGDDDLLGTLVIEEGAFEPGSTQFRFSQKGADYTLDFVLVEEE